MAKRRRSRRNRQPQEAGSPIIDPYKVTGEDILAEYLAALEYEQPQFAVPGLDEVLEGTDREVDRMWLIYKL